MLQAGNLERSGLPVRLWKKTRAQMPLMARHRRYLGTIVLWLAIIWGTTFAYLWLVPDSYTSRFTLILPGSGAGSTMNVESIGQAQSSSASAFSSTSLSPTENYKRLLMSDIVLRDTANSLERDPGSIAEPTIKLVDQTNLIEVKMSGQSGKKAHTEAQALKRAFLDRLDTLRDDEAAKREESESKNLVTLEKKVRDTQQALLDFQARTGLVSLQQFNDRIAGLDALKAKEREARVSLAQKGAEAGRLSGILNMGTSQANQSLRLRSDPIFQQLANRYAEVETKLNEKSAMLGDQHGSIVQLRAERDEVKTALVKRGGSVTGLNENGILKAVDISVSNGRSNLMQAMAVTKAHTAGARAGLAAIRRDITKQGAQSEKLVREASKLADLMRDHRVAEAVFSSALARIDTNKQDPFASYPLVQTLEQPSLPATPSSPSLPITLAAGIGASLLMLFGLSLLWFRRPILRKITPKF